MPLRTYSREEVSKLLDEALNGLDGTVDRIDVVEARGALDAWALQPLRTVREKLLAATGELRHAVRAQRGTGGGGLDVAPTEPPEPDLRDLLRQAGGLLTLTFKALEDLPERADVAMGDGGVRLARAGDVWLGISTASARANEDVEVVLALADRGEEAAARGAACNNERTGHCSHWGPDARPCDTEAGGIGGRCCYCHETRSRPRPTPTPIPGAGRPI